MNFFEQLAGISEGLDLTIRIKGKNGKLTLSVLPDGIEKVQPLLLTGTPQELDEAFIEAIKQPLADTKTVLVNNESYQKELSELEKDKKKKLDKKKKDQDKKAAKPAATTTKPAKKNSAKPKPAAKDKKKVEVKKPAPAKPAEVKKEEPTGPKQLSII